MIKRILFSISVMLLVATFGARAQKYLNLGFENGAAATFVISDKLSVAVDGGALVVSADEGRSSYTLADLCKYEYSDVAASGADVPAVGTPQLSLTSDGLTVSFGTPGHSVRVFDAAGRLVLERHAADTFTLAAGALPQGAYVLVIDSTLTFKVALK